MQDNWIYLNTADNKARFVLGKKGKKTLICIGINPSTATPTKLDNTINRLSSFSNNLNYDSWVMLNIYPQRATKPNDLDKKINIMYHKENLKHISNILKKGNCDIWAAWGTAIEKRDYLLDCLMDIYKISKLNSVKWYSVGKISKNGHPHHPLYLNKTLKLKKFNTEKYLKSQTSS